MGGFACVCGASPLGLQGVPAQFAGVSPLGLRGVPARFAGCPCLVCRVSLLGLWGVTTQFAGCASLVCSAHAVGAQPVLPSAPHPCPLVSPCHCSGTTKGRGDSSPGVSEQRVAMLCAPHQAPVLSRLQDPGGHRTPQGGGQSPGASILRSVGGRRCRALLQ